MQTSLLYALSDTGGTLVVMLCIWGQVLKIVYCAGIHDSATYIISGLHCVHIYIYYIYK